MTKTLLTAALIATFGIAGIANAADGTITFNGKVTNASCQISVNGGTASPTIVLPGVQTTDLASTGATAGFTPVSIALSNCSAGSGSSNPTLTTVQPYFEPGAGTDTTTGYLKNTGTATNVQVILSKDATVAGKLALNQGQGQQGVVAQNITSNPTFTYYAGYVASAAATPGTVISTVQYTLNYQ